MTSEVIEVELRSLHCLTIHFLLDVFVFVKNLILTKQNENIIKTQMKFNIKGHSWSYLVTILRLPFFLHISFI